MCGIAGIWHRDGRDVEPSAIQSMVDTLIHRGPDGEGIDVAGPIALGHRRLKVIDLTDAAAQPMWLPDRSLCLLYNGEIHNYLELTAQLRAAGVRLRSQSDTEVVLWSYHLWGDACFNRFNGMWAVAFWQPAEARLVLCRDRFGIKPLVYSVRGARVAFASEPKALVAAFPEERRADRQRVHDFLAGGLPDCDEHTFFANIRAVLPGQLITIDQSGEVSRPYWDFEPGEEAARPDAAEVLHSLLDDAVRLRLRSDVPVGVSLSGGLDSSSVARLAARSSSTPLHCFSLKYASRELDESGYASMVADDPARYRMHWVTPESDGFLATVNAIVWHHDAPTPIRGRYPQWHILRQAAEHVTVVLAGEGADETLGGYDRFVLPYALDRLTPRIPQQRSRWALGSELIHLGKVSKGIHRLLPRLALRALARRNGASRGAIVQALSHDWRTDCDPVAAHRLADAWLDRRLARPYASRLNNALWAELRLAGLPELLHADDAISMAFSLESRLPFLDHRVVEFCFSLAFDEKIGAGWTKLVLRRAMEGVLPEPVRWRRQKMGCPGDYRTWLAGDHGMETLRAVLLDGRTRQRGMLNPQWLQRTLGGTRDKAQRCVRRHLAQFWSLLTLELWCRQFLDGDRFMRATAPSMQ